MSALAQFLSIPNSSFESPTPPIGFPAWPQIDFWQKPPAPDGLPLPVGITWEQLAGVFPNTPSNDPRFIDNMDGSQSAYIFALPGVALYQNLDATFVPGQSYTMTFGILGGGGITEGTSIRAQLFYGDTLAELQPVSATTVTFNSVDFPNATHLRQFQVDVPSVGADSAWSGKRIGLGFFALNGDGSGYWDIDQVTITSVPEPSVLGLGCLAAIGLGAFIRRRRLQ